MAPLYIALSTWLHSLATIVMVGYFLFARLVYLPVLEGRMKQAALREVLEQVSARLRPYFGGALLIFLVTGTHLMLINENYRGVGDIFANSWSILIVVKHVLVLVFLALAVISERVYLKRVSDQHPEALRQFRRALGADLVLGAAILLLTSIAQAG